MIAATMTFVLKPSLQVDIDRDKARDSVIMYLGSLNKNGHIFGEEVLVWSAPDTMQATAYVTDTDALDDALLPPWVLKYRDEMLAFFEPPSHLITSWPWTPRERAERAPSFYLFTHFLDRTSPLCAGDDGWPVPLYRLGLDQRTLEGLSSWAGDYRLHDELAIRCGALEMPAYRQLAEADSALSQWGRKLCSAVESVVGRPVYYFLHRYWGFWEDEREAARPCPGCGVAWRVTATGGRGLGWFDFVCEPCRLVSHKGSSRDDDEKAEIGMWNPQSAT